MRKFIELVKRFRREDDGAAMIEYTILLGIITAAVITSVIWVGGWVGTQWTALSGTLAG